MKRLLFQGSELGSGDKVIRKSDNEIGVIERITEPTVWIVWHAKSEAEQVLPSIFGGYFF
jgi:hypothetical protein